LTALFISDLHIDASHPAINEQFLSFLSAEARDADALYILGDLFESWIGDDAPDAAQVQAIAGIASLTSLGVPCFVMHGNRDFLLAQRFCAMSGAALLPDPVIVTLYGERVLVMHGDALCTDDRAYQRLRATVRDPDWQRQFLALPVESRRALAGAARVGSQAHTASLEYSIADVSPSSVETALRGRDRDASARSHTPPRGSRAAGRRPPVHAHRARRLV
jgi:UDP-2,3-diacylglucosamine hydrolase